MVELSHRLVGQRPAIAGLVVVVAAIALAPPDAEADAPPCRYTLDIPSDTVLDNDTSLIWQRTVSVATYTRSNAASYCASLSGPWRLPSIQELQTLVDDSKYNPAIDSAAFPNTPNTPGTSFFWSSSVCAGNPGDAWIVDFYDGDVNYNSVGSTYRVRCVR